eukprot:5316030-Alexandrium_andersonii.AAC.1
MSAPTIPVFQRIPGEHPGDPPRAHLMIFGPLLFIRMEIDLSSEWHRRAVKLAPGDQLIKACVAVFAADTTAPAATR